ncbi:MAG: peptidyl-prolyl cis-trans isomerase D [Pseudomonadales bacterium]|jgi:peptidyl-prolyl cis-trans isomerase D
MLEYIRDNVKGTFGYVLLVVICIPFVAFGIDALFTTEGSQTVATVNGEDIEPNELAQEVYLYKRRLASQMGGSFDPAAFEDKTLEGPVLEKLVSRKLLSQAANDAAIVVGKDQIDREIVNQQQFQLDGVFSADVYQNILRGAGLTPKIYRTGMAEQAQLQQFMSGYLGSSIVASVEIDVALSLVNQTRDISYLVLPLEAANIAVAEQDIEAYYQDNIAKFQTEELVSVDYVELSLTDIDVEISEDELATAYNTKVSESATEARRKVAHILLEQSDKAIISTITERLAAGDDFGLLAKEFSEDIATANQGGDLGYALPGAFPPEFDEALASLTVDQVSAPVQTDAGTHFIKLLEIEAVESSSFEQERDSILADLKRAKAEPLFAEKIEQLADQVFSAIDLVEPGQALDLTVSNSGLFSRDGSITGLFTNTKIVDAAYSDLVLNQQNNSDVIEISSDRVVVVRLSEHQPPKAKPITQVAKGITQILARQKASDQVRDEVDELLAQGVSKDSLVAKADELRTEVVELAGITRTAVSDADGDVVAAAFNAQPIAGEAVGSVALRDGSVAVYTVNNIANAPAPERADPQIAAVARMLANTHSQQDIVALEAQLKADAAIQIN